ncbi:ATP-binding protein, partial [Methanosarcina sp. A14]
MVSERRNELLAETLHEIHLIEKWGRGISLILYKEPETDFKEVGTQFIVTFKRKQMEAEEKAGEKEVTGKTTKEKTREK